MNLTDFALINRVFSSCIVIIHQVCLCLNQLSDSNTLITPSISTFDGSLFIYCLPKIHDCKVKEMQII